MAEKEIARLSPSIAKILLQRSPLHAWQAHRLLGGTKSKGTKEMDEGKLIESLLFDMPMENLVLIDADSFRTKDAQQQRDAAILAGNMPILAKDFEKYTNAAAPMGERLARKGIDLKAGQKQHRIEWQSLNPQAPGLAAGVACSGVLDQLVLDEFHGHALIRDLKTCDNAKPQAIQRKFVDLGYHIQGAAYLEAVNSAYPWTAGRTEIEFVYVERDAPNAVTVVKLSGGMLELGQRQWRRAVDQWGLSMATNRWPDYTNIPVRLEALPWQLTQDAEQELDEIERNSMEDK